ncbi:hypothetical protein E4U52_000383 [Claviceps spartinae]|nr:hypothetical protein E4U52_000383 [Claviceps spartinae]
MAGLEARPEDLEEASVLDKRARRFSKTIRIPQSRMREVKRPPIYLDEVRVEFLMAQKQINKGNRMVTQWYCKSLRFTNVGKVSRRVTARFHSMQPVMQELLPPRTSKVVTVPKNVSEFIMEWSLVSVLWHDLGVVILLTELKALHIPIVTADDDDFAFTMDAVGEHWSLYGTCHHIDAMRPGVREIVRRSRRNTPARRQEDTPASSLSVHDRNPFDTEGFM